MVDAGKNVRNRFFDKADIVHRDGTFVKLTVVEFVFDKFVDKVHKLLVVLNLPVTPENDYLADPETSKLVVVIDKLLRVFVVRGLSTAAGQDPIADCSRARSAADYPACFDVIVKTLGQNQRMLKEGLYLEADADAPYGFVSGVLEAFRGIGLESVDIVTDPGFKAVLE